VSAPIRRILVLNVGKPENRDVAQRSETVALREAQPDYVVFVGSHPTRSQAGSVEYVDEYVRLVSLSPDRYEVLVLPDPDDLVDCYQRLVLCLEGLRARFPGAELLADYTAGTKTMSAALALAAVDNEQSPEVKLRLVRGQRGQEATVIPGTESFVAVPGIHDLRARRLVSRARDALERFDYAAADRLLGQALQREISPSLRGQLERVRNLCRAFDAWDRYDLERTATLLGIYREDWYQWLKVLQQLQGVTRAFTAKENRQSPDQPRLIDLDQLRDPYVAVEDLLLNAERRAAQGRYDDAMARVYRALELFVQLRLWLGHRIDTGDVDLTRLPEDLRSQYATRLERGRPLTLALLQAWDVLAAFPDDPLADWLRAERGRLLDWTRHRNYSLLAHGFTPVTQNVWREYGCRGIELCREGLAVLAEKKMRRPLKHCQFPQADLLSQVS